MAYLMKRVFENEIYIGRGEGGIDWGRDTSDRLCKAPKHHTKTRQTIEKTQKTILQSPKILDKDLKHLTIVATHINLTSHISKPTFKTPCIN